jgi:hypothetical protein
MMNSNVNYKPSQAEQRMQMRILNLPEQNNESEPESKIIRVRIRYSANIFFPTNRIPPAGTITHTTKRFSELSLLLIVYTNGKVRVKKIPIINHLIKSLVDYPG